jgi:hypothetical protein
MGHAISEGLGASVWAVGAVVTSSGRGGGGMGGD